ncbi:hypothetical protein X741_31920 [Mesorhizobium sp. LNHC229A00]|nr:hypothetical protein X741_31920 [Mesorhizobium sp. LNHC229A00]
MALLVIEGGLSTAYAVRTYGVSPKIVARWVERYKTEGSKGMADRSSRPNVMPGLTSQAVAERIVVLRRQRLTGKHIAVAVSVSPATVSRVLRRAGLSRLKDIAPAEPIRRYEREHPRDMIHIATSTSRSSDDLNGLATAYVGWRYPAVGAVPCAPGRCNESV